MKSFITKITQTAFLVALLFGATNVFADSFDANPALPDFGYYGTASINDCDGANCGNQDDSLSYGSIGSNGEFTVFLNFRNSSSGTISGARGSIIPAQYSGTSSSVSFATKLTGAGTRTDSVSITNLPDEWELEFVEGEVYVDDRTGSAGTLCSDAFPSLQIPRHSNANPTNSSGAYIGNLTYGGHQGWCDQGYVEATFKITEVETVVIEDIEVETKNPTNIDEDSAQLNGELNSGDNAGVWFVYGTSPAIYCPTSGTVVNVSGSYDSGDDFSATANGLNSDTHYYYRACAEDGSQGSLKDFYTDDGDVVVNYTYSWETGSWGQCVNGVKTRDVYCEEDQTGNEVNDSNCSNSGAEPAASSTSGCSDNTSDDLEVDTEGPSSVGTDTATLNGEIVSGESNGVYFVLDDDSSFNCYSSGSDVVHVYSVGGGYDAGDDFDWDIPGNSFLEANTQYWYRACAQEIGSSSVVDGGLVSFYTNDNGTSSDTEPVAETKDEDDVDENSAELNGRIDMNDYDNGVVFFVYGQDESQIEDVDNDYDEYSDVDNDGDDLQKVKVDDNNDSDSWENYSRTVSGLDTDEDYYFRICVEFVNENGDDELECGEVKDFQTDDDGSSNNNDVEVVTLSPNSVTQTTAEMCGDLQEDNGSSQQTWIEFRTSNGSYTATPTSQRSEGNWCTRVSNLTPNTTYLYRACTPYGCAPTRTFRTLGSTIVTGQAPIISTENPTNILSNSALLQGYYVTNAPTGRCWFNYGRTSSLGKRSNGVYNVGSGYGTCTHNFTGLASGTPYCVQAVIETAYGTDTGAVKCFTTPRSVVVNPSNPQPPVVVTTPVEDETEIDYLGLGLGLSLVRLDIDDNEEVVTNGTTVEYEVEWENISELDLEDLELIVTIPKEIQITDISRGRLDSDSNTIYFTIDELDGADYENNRPGDNGRMTVNGTVGRGTVGNLLTADAELVYDNPINDAQENARDFDLDEYGVQFAGQTASVFGGLAQVTFLGWLVILLGLFIIFLVARWLYLEREELRAQAYIGGYNTPYGGNIAAPRYDNGYAQPQAPIYREPAPRYDAPQAPMAPAPQDDYYQPYSPNRGQ